MLTTWRTLRTATWLGWQVESNWAEPWLFAIYVLIKPITGSLLLVGMYYAARSVNPTLAPEFLPFLYVGNACYALVAAVTFGLSYVVISDREHYGMLKYVVISPAALKPYFIGRGLARVAQALIGVVLNLTAGTLFFVSVRTALTQQATDWAGLLLSLLLGVVMLTALGVILAAIVMNMARHGMFLSEGIAGLLYLLSGAVFPLGVLPGWAQTIGLCLPTTYWIEGMRQSLLGPAPAVLASPLRDWSGTDLALAMLVSTAVTVALSQIVFAWGYRRAWRLGRFEERTGV